MTRSRVPGAVAVALAGALLLVGPAVAQEDAGPPSAGDLSPFRELANPDGNTLQDSVVSFDDNIIDLDENIEDVESTPTTSTGSVITLTTDILFDFDSADLSDAAKDRIREIAQDIPSGASVTVGGHTDSKGAGDYNQDLSEQRAEAVAEVLAESDSSPPQIESEGFGDTDPVASNGTEAEDDPEGRAKNRRVEIEYDE